MKSLNRPRPTYQTEYTREKVIYGNRVLLPASVTLNRELAQNRTDENYPPVEEIFDVPTRQALKGYKSKERTITVLSYNTLSQNSAKKLSHYAEISVLNWLSRRQVLLREIFSMDADILCLQEVDDFDDWWRPQLSSAGYDSVYKRRTEHLRPRQEGVVIAYKRDSFQMFRSDYIELNDAVTDDIEDRNLAARSITDHCAVMMQLQPWEMCDDPTGVLVCCAILEERPELEAVRMLQGKYLAHKIEKFNSDFHLPVILCGSFHCEPGGLLYETLTTGRLPIDPQPPGAPVHPPRVAFDRFNDGKATSHSSIVLEWDECEDLDHGLSPVPDGYWVSYRIGGNKNLAFKDKQYFPREICIPEKEAEFDYTPELMRLKGLSKEELTSECSTLGLKQIGSREELVERIKEFALKMREMNKGPEVNTLRRCVITELSSGITYEFKVAGQNEIGIGVWSQVSEPICTERLYPKLEGMPTPVKRSMVIESLHPYRPSMDVKETVMLTGCRFGATLTFDKKCKLEIDADVLCFYNDEDAEDIMVARDENNEEIDCVFDGDYRLDKGASFPTLMEVCRSVPPREDGPKDDKPFTYTFISDDANEYWGYRFVLEWDDFTEIAKIEEEQERERMAREGAKRKWLCEIDEVRKLQVVEEKERVEMHERVLELQKKAAGLVVINGVETTMPSSKTTPRFLDGTENTLVAPVRKQDLRLFPSYGFRDQNEEVYARTLEKDQMEKMRKMREDDLVAVDTMAGAFSGSASKSGRFSLGGGRRDLRDLPEKINNSKNHIISSKVGKLNIHDKMLDERTKNMQKAWQSDAKLQIGALKQDGVDGLLDKRQIHYLQIKSAYRGYCAGGEPIYTGIDNGKARTSDYIMASEEALVCTEILSIPELRNLSGNNPSERSFKIDYNYESKEWEGLLKMEDFDASEDGNEGNDMASDGDRGGVEMTDSVANDADADADADAAGSEKLDQSKKKDKPFAGYRGIWQPYLRLNPQKQHHLVPNSVHPSNHFPLLAKFRFQDNHLSGLWHGGKDDEDEDEDEDED